jgi:hypothetical protein
VAEVAEVAEEEAAADIKNLQNQNQKRIYNRVYFSSKVFSCYNKWRIRLAITK